MFLIACISLSHGSMGEAMPHALDGQPGYASSLADHHDDAGDDDSESVNDAPDVTGHHVHLVGNLADTNGIAAAQLPGTTLIMRRAPRSAARLAARAAVAGATVSLILSATALSGRAAH